MLAPRLQMTDPAANTYEPNILDSKLPEYMCVPGLPEHFVLLVNTVLIVENTALPIHSQILAIGSPVFCDYFVTALTSGKNRRCTVTLPLVTDSLETVCIALRYLYDRLANRKRPETLGKSLAEAEAVLGFAHKYDMKNVLEECEPYLVQAVAAGTIALDVSETAVRWLALAEGRGLGTLLAHIELHMIKYSDSKF